MVVMEMKDVFKLPIKKINKHKSNVNVIDAQCK